jgi:membrane protease YdiL (CAAX protease family)
MKTKKVEIIVLFVVIFVAGLLYLTGMPLCLFDVSIQNKDLPFINAMYIVNTFFLSIVVIVLLKITIKDLVFGFASKNLLKSLLGYGKIFLLGTLVVLSLGIYIYKPLNGFPTVGEIILWVLLFNFTVAIIEEILLRVLLIRVFDKIFVNNIMLAVVVASVMFGIAHIPGMIQESGLVIIIRVLGTSAVGISLWLIYVKTRNIWSVIILHFILNSFGSGVYYFSNSDNVYQIAKIWPIPMIIVCIINLFTIKIGNKGMNK